MQGGATSPQNEPISSADEEAAKDETEYVIPEEQPGNNDEGVGDVRNNTEACSGDEEVGGVQEVSATDDDEDEDGTKADDDQPVPERYIHAHLVISDVLRIFIYLYSLCTASLKMIKSLQLMSLQ